MLERFLWCLLRAARRWRRSGDRWQRVARFLSRLVLGASIAHLAALLALVLAFRIVGERWWPLWPLLFMPPAVTLLPLLGLVPAALLLCRRAVLVQALAVAFVVFAYMGFRWPLRPAPSGERTLVVLTANMGQRNKAPLSPFIAAENPDVLALQDFANRGARYAREHPGYHVAAHDEFVLLSRYPITASGLVDDLAGGHAPVAAWFELDWDGTTVVVYNVHMPSPRRDLLRLQGKGLAKEWIRQQGWLGREPHESVAHRLARRNELAAGLAARCRSETRPLIVAGDLNMPDWGSIFKGIADEGALVDAFRERGKGFGYTFPGINRNPLSLFGPWLRLDYVLCNARFMVRRVATEPRSRAQHRAVAAHLAMKED